MRKTHRLRRHGQTALTLACLAASVSGSAWRSPQLPQRPALSRADPAPAAQPAIVAAVPAVPVAAPAAVTQPEAPAPVVVVEPAAEPAPTVVVEAAPVREPVQAVETAPRQLVAAHAGDRYYEHLRARLRWVPVRVGGREFSTPDADSRLLLVRSAAERAGLAEVGLDFRDVYGVINAETTWVARTGMGRNGVASYGLAQFEPATARAVGVRDANDPVEAVHGAAKLLKEAAVWSAARIAGLGLGEAERAARLREGVSIYYNLSSRARARWTGTGSAHLPIETQRHIVNVRAGARQADRLLAGGEAELKALVADAAAAVRHAPEERPPARVAAARRVSATPPKPAQPQPLGTIAWSAEGQARGDASRRTGRHVVWSNGAVTREDGGRVRWSSNGGTARPG